ncbi:MAG TPA: uroporphyrinogen-III C-methyltransferase [Candidatus Acidoferrales bacterium]|jgi:uroporphyrinogen III methyltransferase/synthase|nr:uroporphyrinogen-III C-methyltransferase [Candidatus Acidoferrales bacterium]
MKSKGAVYLVGAGPGDAGLLTLRGAELLRRADVVIYDLLVNPALLRLAPAGAELISRGKRADVPQEKINALLIQKAGEGKTVVRLKGGDPYIFGRGGEEAAALAKKDIPFEVVPGVSSIVAAPNYAGIPLTHREHCSSFTVFTGHEDPEDGPVDMMYEQIAKIPGTKVALMGTAKLDEWAKALVKHGVPAKTPVAIVQWGTLGKQKSAAGTLATIAVLAKEKKMSPPALVILGDVVQLREQLNWFEKRPLFGKRIVVTRAREQAAEFAQKLAGLGADVLEIPMIKLTLPENKQDVVDAMLSLNSYDWLVFTSANGVTAFFDLFFKHFQDLRDIGGAKIAAVGPATAEKLRALHLQVDVVPEESVGKKIAEAIAKHCSIENYKVCLLRAEEANGDLLQALEEFGAIADDIAVYSTVAETEQAPGTVEDFLERGADWVTFTSGSTVRFFHERFNLPKLLKQFPQMKLASIGPETSKALHGLGLKPKIEAKEHTSEGLIAELMRGGKS